MTIDEALERVQDTDECWVVWNSQTGEVLSVTGTAAGETADEGFAHLATMKDYGVPVKTRHFKSAAVTRQVLEQEAAEAGRGRDRRAILTEWSHAPVDDLLTILERGDYQEPMGRRDSRIITDHLWEVHREELTERPRERLRLLLGTGLLHDDAARKLGAYLAALDGDEARLKALWTGEVPGKRCWADAFAIMEGMAHVGTRDQGFIGDLLAVFDANIPFGGKYETMINLGRIGAAAGSRAASVIRAHVLDTEPWIIAARDRVLACLEAGDQWTRCVDCCHGRVHGTDTFAERPCPVCLGLGFRPAAELQGQASQI